MSQVQVPNIPSPYHELFYGSYEYSYDEEYIRGNNIKYIVSLDPDGYDKRKELEERGLITRYWYTLYDDSSGHFQNKEYSANIIAKAAKQIRDCLLQGNTYVHCYAGMNRAPTCVAAFMIIYLDLGVIEVTDKLIELNRIYRDMPCLLNYKFLRILNDEIVSLRIIEHQIRF